MSSNPRGVAVITALVLAGYLVLGVIIDQKRATITYYVSQWMITFAAGFIRRGILGQAVWDVSQVTSIPPVAIIKFFQYILAIGFCFVLGFQCFKNRNWLGVSGICLVLANPFLSKYVWLETGSSDLLFILLPLGNLWLTQYHPSHYVKWATIFMATAGLFVGLSHEAFILLCLPINLAISWRFLDSRKLLKLLIIYLIPILGCAAEVAYHGTAGQAKIIEGAWKSIGLNVPPGSAIHYLGLNARQELGFVAGVVHPVTVAVWTLATTLCTIPLFYLGRQLMLRFTEGTRKQFRNRLRDFYVIPLLCTVPMYIIGSDWDRWPSISITTGTLCMLMVANREFEGKSFQSSRWVWAALIFGCLLIRPVTPNVSIGAVFTGPIDVSIKMAFHRRI